MSLSWTADVAAAVQIRRLKIVSSDAVHKFDIDTIVDCHYSEGIELINQSNEKEVGLCSAGQVCVKIQLELIDYEQHCVVQVQQVL